MRNRIDQAASERASAGALSGLHLPVIAEIVIVLTATLAFGAFLGVPDRFANITPHPFWIIVILAATRHGIGAGLTAAALASGALLAGNIPEQAFDENLADWLLRTTKLPVIWFLTATVLGEIRSSHVRVHCELVERFQSLRARADRIAHAYEEVAQAKFGLEQRISDQKRTLRATYDASRSIERESVAAVLDGALPFVKSIIDPGKASVFILADDKLKVLAQDGWTEADGFADSFDATSPLFETIVAKQDHLSVVVPAQEAALGGQGLMAGPLVDEDSGRVFGMLKIEDTGLSGLSASSAIEFRVVCNWIGRACGNACRGTKKGAAGARQKQMAPGAATLEPVTNDNWQQVFLAAGAPSSVVDTLARHLAMRAEARIASTEPKRAGAAAKVALRPREEVAERDRVIN